MTSRRAFLKLGVVGAITLAAGGAVYRLTQAPAERFTLNEPAGAVLAAIVPAMLGPLLPVEPVARKSALDGAVANTLAAIHGLPLSTQQEIQNLFGLLALAPARRLLAGVSEHWEQAAPEQVAAFLTRWRHHRLATLQSAYLALHDLILGPWYATPSAWAGIGYPGPPQELLK